MSHDRLDLPSSYGMRRKVVLFRGQVGGELVDGAGVDPLRRAGQVAVARPGREVAYDGLPIRVARWTARKYGFVGATGIEPVTPRL